MSHRIKPLKATIVSAYATAPLEDLERLSMKERFLSIRALTAHIFNAAAQHDRIESSSTLRSHFPEEYDALTNLALSFSHTNTFSRLIVRATDRVIDHIGNDEESLNALRNWRKITLADKESALTNIIKRFILSVETLSNIHFSLPIIGFFYEPKDEEGCILEGYYIGINDMKHKNIGKVGINTHHNAGFYCVTRVAATALHEAVHAIQDELAKIGERTPTKVKNLAYDCRLSLKLDEYDANISHKFGAAYRAQFHERIAYAADERFSNNLKYIL